MNYERTILLEFCKAIGMNIAEQFTIPQLTVFFGV
jgi:hypothetical protein